MQAVIFDLYETLVTLFVPDWLPPRESIAQRLDVDERTFEETWSRRAPARRSWADSRRKRAG